MKRNIYQFLVLFITEMKTYDFRYLIKFLQKPNMFITNFMEDELNI